MWAYSDRENGCVQCSPCSLSLMFQSGPGPVTRQPSSKLSSHPIKQTHEQSVCEKASAGGHPAPGAEQTFFMLSATRPRSFFLSGPFLLFFILSPGGITHFEKANISYRLALRQTFFPLSPPPVGRTLFNSPLIMFLFRSRVHNQFLEAADGRSLLIGHINHQVCYLSFQMFAIMDIYIYLDILWLTIRRERAEVRVFISLMIISHCTSRQWRTYAHNAQG